MDLMKLKEMFERDFGALQHFERLKYQSLLQHIATMKEPYDAEALAKIQKDIDEFEKTRSFFAQKHDELISEITSKISAVVAEKANKEEKKNG